MSGIARLPTVTLSPRNAFTCGALLDVASVPRMSMPPPEPTTTVAVATAPADSARTSRPPARGTRLPLPRNAWVVLRTSPNAFSQATSMMPPAPPLAVPLAACDDVASTSMVPAVAVTVAPPVPSAEPMNASTSESTLALDSPPAPAATMPTATASNVAVALSVLWASTLRLPVVRVAPPAM